MKLNTILIFLIIGTNLFAQPFTKQDSLRGSITPERAWWDLTYYQLDIEVLPKTKTIKGSNLVQYQVLQSHDILQIDLQRPLKITKVMQDGKKLRVRSDGNAHFIKLEKKQVPGDINSLEICYEGAPREAKRAPWDGGFSWGKDLQGNDFIATSCQGLGASVWWPCKDHMYDEVDSMLIRVEVPENLVDVSNGRLRGITENTKKKTKTYHWFVANPINNYGVNVNIGDYVHWEAVYEGEKGPLDLSYWVLRQDEKLARTQFEEVPRMLKAFEHWFGPYPFYEDSYKLVHVPYLGMEHQSSVTYGNGFANGYRGTDLSGTGWGMKFDFIIIHESGHEWFANNITHRDMADMWIHESFTNYSESLFLEYYFGKEAGQEYVRGIRKNISNDRPMIGPYNVNNNHYSGDVYYKGANMLNTLRTVVDDDTKWRDMLRALNKKFYHQTVSSDTFEAYMGAFLSLKLAPFFDQYLRTANIPILEYYFKEGQLYYRWINTILAFDMPVDIFVKDKKIRIHPTAVWNQMELDGNMLRIDPNYYIGLMQSR